MMMMMMMKDGVTSFFMYLWLVQGCFAFALPNLALSVAFGVDKPSRETTAMCAFVGVLKVCLSLMTCPNPHGYFMASCALALGALRIGASHGVLVGKTWAGFALLAGVPLVLATLAVLDHHHGVGQGAKRNAK